MANQIEYGFRTVNENEIAKPKDGKIAELERQLASNLIITESGNQSMAVAIPKVKEEIDMNVVPYDDRCESPTVLYDSSLVERVEIPVTSTTNSGSVDMMNKVLETLLQSHEKENIELRKRIEELESGRFDKICTENRIVETVTYQRVQSQDIKGSEVVGNHNTLTFEEALKALHSQEKCLVNMKEELEKKEIEFSQMSETLHKLNEENHLLKFTTSNMQKEYLELKSSFESSQKEKMVIVQQFDTCKVLLANLEGNTEKAALFEAKVGTMTSQLAESWRKNDLVNDKVSKLNLTVETLRNENSVMSENVRLISNEKIGLYERISELDRERGERCAQYESQLNTLRTELAERERLIDQHTNKWHSLQNSVCNLVNKYPRRNQSVKLSELRPIFDHFDLNGHYMEEDENEELQHDSSNGNEDENDRGYSCERVDYQRDDDNESVTEVFNSQKHKPSEMCERSNRQIQRSSSRSLERQKSPSPVRSRNVSVSPPPRTSRSTSPTQRHRSRSMRRRSRSSHKYKRYNSKHLKHRSRGRERRKQSTSPGRKAHSSNSSPSNSLPFASGRGSRFRSPQSSKTTGKKMYSRRSGSRDENSTRKSVLVNRPDLLEDFSLNDKSSKYHNSSNSSESHRRKRRSSNHDKSINTETPSQIGVSPPFLFNLPPFVQGGFPGLLPQLAYNWPQMCNALIPQASSLSFANNGISAVSPITSSKDGNRISTTVQGSAAIPFVLNVGGRSSNGNASWLVHTDSFRRCSRKSTVDAKGYNHGRHPIKELDDQCLKRGWDVPIYKYDSAINGSETHYFCDVKVNGVWYQPKLGSTNSRDAQFLAALHALQQLNVS